MPPPSVIAMSKATKQSRIIGSGSACTRCRHRPEIGKIPASSGRGVKQGTGIGLLRICQDSRRRSLFDNAAFLHHCYIVADLRSDPQIVSTFVDGMSISC